MRPTAPEADEMIVTEARCLAVEDGEPSQPDRRERD
jgi:hypothetical protein